MKSGKGFFRQLIALISVLALVATACSGASTTEDTADSDNNEPRVVEVTMSEFEFSPSSISVKAGETVKFVVTNDGMVEHEFEITTEHEAGEHIEGGHEEGHNGQNTADNKISVKPGETGELTYTFESDASLLFGCLLPGHYEAGMKGEFEVEGSSATTVPSDEQEQEHEENGHEHDDEMDKH